MSLIRNIYVTDPVVPTRKQTVNASGEALTKDTSGQAILTTIDTAVDLSNSILTTIDTAVDLIATKQSDKSQFTKITDGTDTLLINASGEALTHDTDFLASFNTTKSKVSTDNSSTTPLNAAAVFTGAWEDATLYQSVIIAVATDQNGSYTVQFSPDGVNADATLTRYYRTTNINAPHRFTNTRKYVRVVFTNTSASNQTYFRLQTLIGEKSELNAPIDSVLSQDFDATVVRPTHFNYEVALGRRQGSTTWNKFGHNEDIDIGTEVLAYQGGTFTFLTAASTLTIVSSSTDDDGAPAGIGANTITIYGVDANRIAQTEIVTLNGTTNVVTATTWLGINRAAVSLSGSTYSNVGNITITATTGGTTQGYIPAGKGTTQQLIFFTQADHALLVDWLWINAEKISGGTTPKAVFKGWVYSAVTNTKTEIFYSVVDTNVETDHSFVPPHPYVVGEKSVLWFEVTTDVNNTIVSGRFSGIEFRDVDA